MLPGSADVETDDEHARQASPGRHRPGPSKPAPDTTDGSRSGVPFHPVVAAVHRTFMDHRPLTPLARHDLADDHPGSRQSHQRPRRRATTEDRQPPREGHDPGAARRFRQRFPRESVGGGLRRVLGADPGSCRTEDRLVPASFSTTGPVERAAAEVVLLDAMQSYFEYIVDTRCGIPDHHPGGDTRGLAGSRRASTRLPGFGLGSWLDVLAPILDQFARASRGDVRPGILAVALQVQRPERWSRDLRLDHGILPVPERLPNRTSHRACHRVFRLREGQPRCDAHPDGVRGRGWTQGPTIEELPGGLSKAPFRWDYLDRSFDMEFLGGFVGVAQDQETLTLRPEIGWAVREAPATG